METEYVVDQDGRLGKITGRYLGYAYLRPPGGGKEWRVRPESLRKPTEQELASARILSTPATSMVPLPIPSISHIPRGDD